MPSVASIKMASQLSFANKLKLGLSNRAKRMEYRLTSRPVPVYRWTAQAAATRSSENLGWRASICERVRAEVRRSELAAERREDGAEGRGVTEGEATLASASASASVMSLRLRSSMGKGRQVD